MIEGAAVLRMSWTIDLANQADVPLTIDMNVSKMVVFEAGLRVPWVVTVKWAIYRYSV